MRALVTPTFESAGAADLGAICAMLAASNLPVDDVEQHIDAPPGICASAQFRSLCPATASCMRKPLLSAAGPKSSAGTGSK